MTNNNIVLQYVDDTKLIVKADVEVLATVNWWLDSSKKISGIHVNYGKSLFVPINVQEVEPVRLIKLPCYIFGDASSSKVVYERLINASHWKNWVQIGRLAREASFYGRKIAFGHLGIVINLYLLYMDASYCWNGQ